MYQVKCLTGTALGSRNTLCFSGWYKRRKSKPRQGVQLAGGSRGCWWQLTCEPGNSCTGMGQWHLSGAGDTQLQAQLTCYSAPTWFGFYPLPSGVICCFLPAYGWVDLCGTAKDTITFTSTAVHPCLSHCHFTQGRIQGQTWSSPGPSHPTPCPNLLEPWILKVWGFLFVLKITNLQENITSDLRLWRKLPKLSNRQKKQHIAIKRNTYTQSFLCHWTERFLGYWKFWAFCAEKHKPSREHYIWPETMEKASKIK